MESYGNKLAYVELFCNVIYKYPEPHKSYFYVETCKRQKLWLCQWGHLIFQILMLRFGPVKVSFHKEISYVP